VLLLKNFQKQVATSCYLAICKEMPNKDHTTCGKERFITDRWADPRVQGAVAWLKWVVGFIGGTKPWGRERVSGL
jgi:hypothetical protein